MSTQVMSAFEDLEQKLIEDRGNLPDGVTMSVEAVMNSFINKNSDITSFRQFKVTTTHHAPNNGDMPQDFIEKIYTTVIKGVLNNAAVINSTNLPEVISKIHQAVEGVLNNTQWNSSPLEAVEVALQDAVQNAISSVTEVLGDLTGGALSSSEDSTDNTLTNGTLPIAGETATDAVSPTEEILTEQA